MTEADPAAPAAPGFCPQCGHALDPAGGPRDRPRCPACGYVRYPDPKVAAGVVVQREGRILLVRRNHQPAYGRWSFPSGYVDAGEVVEQAAAREVLEETGVSVRIQHLLGVYSGPGTPVVFVAYAGESTGGDLRPSEEVMEIGLFDPDGLPDLAFPHDPEITEAWRAWRRSRRADATAGGGGAGPNAGTAA